MRDASHNWVGDWQKQGVQVATPIECCSSTSRETREMQFVVTIAIRSETHHFGKVFASPSTKFERVIDFGSVNSVSGQQLNHCVGHT